MTEPTEPTDPVDPTELDLRISPEALAGLELCRNLQWKSITRDLDDPLEVLAQFARNTVPYTCLQTCRNAGPDDELVAPELCHGERGCYEASALSLRLRARTAAE